MLDAACVALRPDFRDAGWGPEWRFNSAIGVSTHERNMMHEADSSDPSSQHVSRRAMLQQSASVLAGLAGCTVAVRHALSSDAAARPAVQTVLGAVSPDKLGV